MKIEHIEVIEMEMPFDKGISKKDQVGFLNWGKLDFCLVKVETSSGITAVSYTHLTLPTICSV